MSSFSDTLEDAFRRAFGVQDPEALRRSVRILEDAYDPYRRLESDVSALKTEVRVIAERMEQGFARMDQRFEAVDRRFEAQDKRFEAVDRRFEHQNRLMFAGFTVLAILMSIYEFVR